MKRFGMIALAGLLSILSAPSQAEPQAQAGMSSFGFVLLEVADMARAQAFYVDALGMKPVYTISKPSDPYEKIAFNFSGDAKSSEPLLILIHYAHPTPVQNRSSGAKLGIRVSDSRAAAERVRAAGFPIVHKAAADAKGPVINSVVRDADGVTVELVELHMP